MSAPGKTDLSIISRRLTGLIDLLLAYGLQDDPTPPEALLLLADTASNIRDQLP